MITKLTSRYTYTFVQVLKAQRCLHPGYTSTVRYYLNGPLACRPPILQPAHQARTCIPVLQKNFVSTDVKKDNDVEPPETDPLCPHFRTAIKKTTEDGHDPNNTNQETLVKGAYTLPHPIWEEDEIHAVEIEHRKPEGFVDKFAYFCVQTMRLGFDVLSGYNRGTPSEKKWLTRIIFLETVAGVPGMVAAMARHLKSLRRMKRDHGWIHTLLEEAENERMHLMTALEIRKPGMLFRLSVLATQGLFVNAFFISYLISPRFCHRFVGYLEEEAVVTYTKLVKQLDEGKLPKWSKMAAPDLAIRYWRLAPDAMMRDVVLAIRADEAHHRDVNHTLGNLKPCDQNPYPPGS